MPVRGLFRTSFEHLHYPCRVLSALLDKLAGRKPAGQNRPNMKRGGPAPPQGRSPPEAGGAGRRRSPGPPGATGTPRPSRPKGHGLEAPKGPGDHGPRANVKRGAQAKPGLLLNPTPALPLARPAIVDSAALQSVVSAGSGPILPIPAVLGQNPLQELELPVSVCELKKKPGQCPGFSVPIKARSPDARQVPSGRRCQLRRIDPKV